MRRLTAAGIYGRTIDGSYIRGILPGNVITYGAPTGQIDISDANAEGTAEAATRTDHQHSFPAPGAGYPQDTADTEADGTAMTPARSDHRHALHVHDAGKHTNRTRYIPLLVYDRTNGTAVPASDDHGGLANGLPHWHLPDGVLTTLSTHNLIAVPADYVSAAVTYKVLYSTTVIGGNLRFIATVWELGSGDAAPTALLSSPYVEAAPAANTVTLFSATLSVAPTAGKHLYVAFQRDGPHADDTNTGQVSVWAIWLEYTADM